MPVYITSLNSGSNGNCYYVGNDKEAILVDAGISCRETEKRLKRLNLCITKIKAIFVSHEHADHINGIPMLAKKYGLPVYTTPLTLMNCGFTLPENQVRFFRPHQPVSIGDLLITAFPKRHDACEPHSFVVNNEGIRVGVFTDIGAACDQLIYHFTQCDAAFLESNYDEDMLRNGGYPYHLKKRISGGYGHLSNKEAFDFFTTHKPAHMSCLILSHLSKNNNCPELVKTLFTSMNLGAEVLIASRFEETPVLTIHRSTPAYQTTISTKKLGKPMQISMF
jgi:phosphoribosyl 1,2-cyclic phosphodiesterase